MMSRRGGPAPLAVLYNGGKELHDSSGHLPRDADGYYLSRSTGERLLVDAGYSEGDAVGPPKVYGHPSATVTGTPASARRSGFDAFSTSDYLTITLASSAAAILVHADSPGATNSSFLGSATGPMWGTFVVGGTYSARAFSSGLAQIGFAGAGSAPAAGTEQYWGAETDGASIDARRYNAAGVLQASGSDTFASQSFAGTYNLGANGLLTLAWAQQVDHIVLVDGSTLGASSMQALVDDLAAAADIDTIRATYSATIATDGMICGAYDAAAPTTLFTLSGSGSDVTVAQP